MQASIVIYSDKKSLGDAKTCCRISPGRSSFSTGKFEKICANDYSKNKNESLNIGTIT